MHHNNSSYNNNYNSIYTFSHQPDIQQSNQNSNENSLSEKLLIAASYAGIALTLPISLPFCLKHVSDQETAVISRLGNNLKQHSTPGYTFSIPYLDTFEKFSKNSISFAIQPLKAITKDLWEIVVQGKASYKINDPLKLVKSTQDGREALIKECTVSTIKKVCGRYNFCRIEDVGILRNEVLLEVNRYSQVSWGIQLVTDDLVLKLDVIKRGEDGPGDPMVQIVKLVKEQFDNSGSQTSLPNLPPQVQQIGQSLLPHLPDITKNQEIPAFPQYQLLVEISKYTAFKAEKSFKKLDSTTFKIQLKDHPDFSFIVDGKDFENPVKLDQDKKVCQVDVTIGIDSKDIPKLLQHEYDALKVWLQGNISISGTNDVNKAVSVGKFLRDLME